MSGEKKTNFKYLEIEYIQVCQNIREGWNYVTTIIRQFITLQIVLISLVGLGNFLVPVNLPISIDASNSDNNSQSNSDSDAKRNSNLTSENNENSDSTSSYSRSFSLLSILSTGSIIALIALGMSISYGAKVQITRIFENSHKFVERAAAIETKLGGMHLDVASSYDNSHGHSYIKNTVPTHVNMLNRLENKNLQQMDVFISKCFNVGFWVWFVVLLLQIYSIFNYFRLLDNI